MAITQEEIKHACIIIKEFAHKMCHRRRIRYNCNPALRLLPESHDCVSGYKMLHFPFHGKRIGESSEDVRSTTAKSHAPPSCVHMTALSMVSGTTCIARTYSFCS